ncbi:MAG: DUF1877 family protein [Paracoccaceae bacterium]
MVMTIRRADPELIADLTDEVAVRFGLGIEEEALGEPEDMIQFFQLWHIVHFLSSGSRIDKTLPAGFMMGGRDWVEAHPDEESFKIFDPDDVKAVAHHLANLSGGVVETRLKMLTTDIPQIYGGPVTEEDFAEVRQVFAEIGNFCQVAAERGWAITTAMS